MNPANAIDWLSLITLGGVAGMLGQGARAVVGLKKAQDDATAANQNLSSTFDANRLLVSLAIGFIAGGIAAIQSHAKIDETQILAYLAVGYIGVDFIEGFIRRTQPSDNTSNARGTPSGGAATGGANTVTKSAGSTGVATDDAVG